MAGLADFKTELAQSDMLDQRLAKIIVKIVDVSYGGDNGFNQVSFGRDQIPIDIFGKDFVAS
jgi:peptide subunit release factor 1 (eRF1)